jgi:hypothetical protein
MIIVTEVLPLLSSGLTKLRIYIIPEAAINSIFMAFRTSEMVWQFVYVQGLAHVIRTELRRPGISLSPSIYPLPDTGLLCGRFCILPLA